MEIIETFEYHGAVIEIQRDSIENYGYSARTKKYNPYVFSYCYHSNGCHCSNGRVFIKKEKAIEEAKLSVDNFAKSMKKSFEEEETENYYFNIEHKTTNGFISESYCVGKIKYKDSVILEVPMKYTRACENVCSFIVEQLNKLKKIEELCDNNYYSDSYSTIEAIMKVVNNN